MSLPGGEPFETFLSETRLESIKPEAQHIVFDIRSDRPFSSEAPVLYLVYPEMDLKLDSVLKRIRSELGKKGCAADDDIALALLGIIAETREPGTSSVEHANQCLSSVHSAQLHQWVVLPPKAPPGYRIKIGEIWLQVFDPEKVLYWAKKGHCSYPVDLRQWAGHLALERALVETTLISLECLAGWHRLIDKWGHRIVMASIVNFYYDAVGLHYFRQIAPLVKDHLLVEESADLIHFDIESFISSPLASSIGLFHWKGFAGSQSWALMRHKSFMYSELPSTDHLSNCDKWFNEELGFGGRLSERPIDATIKLYCRLLQRAQIHNFHGRPDEAFLHFVIALDLLLGQEGRSSESICQRVAVLVHRQLEAAPDVKVKHLKRLYDRRSKYVHKGEKPTPQDLLEIEIICVEILWVLLATSGAQKFHDTDSWLRQVDFIASALNATKEVPEMEIQSIGIPPKGHKRIPPNRVKSKTTVVCPI